MSMIERVARAMHNRRKAIDLWSWQPWDDTSDTYREHSLSMVRTGIEAMLEPTDAMFQATQTRNDTGSVLVNWIYSTMIRAALEEK